MGFLLIGAVLWDNYVDLLKDNSMGYAEKRVRLSNFSGENGLFYLSDSNAKLFI